jgi:hypothetical protein
VRRQGTQAQWRSVPDPGRVRDLRRTGWRVRMLWRRLSDHKAAGNLVPLGPEELTEGHQSRRDSGIASIRSTVPEDMHEL